MLSVRAETEARNEAEPEFPDVSLTAPEVDLILIAGRVAGPPLEPAIGTSGSGATHGSENEWPRRVQILACDSVSGPLSPLSLSLSPSKMEADTSAKEAEAESAELNTVSCLLMAAPKTRYVSDISLREETYAARGDRRSRSRSVERCSICVRWCYRLARRARIDVGGPATGSAHDGAGVRYICDSVSSSQC